LGAPADQAFANTAEIYDPLSRTTQVVTLPVNRAGGWVAVLPDGRVLIAEGNGDLDITAHVYNPSTGAFASAGPMAEVPSSHSVTVLRDGRVLVAGGSVNGAVSTHCQLFNPATNQFTFTGSMLTARSSHQAVLLSNGKVLVAGGGSNTKSEVFDPAT